MSGTDKKKEALNALFADLKNHLKINDFGQIMTDFERLSEEIERAGSGGAVVLEGDLLPLVVVRALAKIEDAINETQ